MLQPFYIIIIRIIPHSFPVSISSTYLHHGYNPYGYVLVGFFWCDTQFAFSSQENVSLYDSEKSLVEALGDTNMTDLKCMWNGTELPTMEWMFLGNSVISPLGVTNESWDMEMLLCTDRSDCSVWQCGNTFIIQGTSNVSLHV